jgi:hypothetical protein
VLFLLVGGIWADRLPRHPCAILRLGQNASWIGGAALGGLVVAATSSGVGIAVDAATFFVAAALLAMIRLPATLRMEASNFLGELAEGWRDSPRARGSG